MKSRLTVLFTAASLAALAATSGASASDCTDAAAVTVSQATITYKGDSWGPVPLYTVDLRPAQNMTIDVAAHSPAEASAVATAALSANCPVDEPLEITPPVLVPPPAAPTPEQTAAAEHAIDGATVTYVGNDWGPTPVFRVELADGHTSVDVQVAGPALINAAVFSWFLTTGIH